MKTVIQKWGLTFYILILSVHLYAQVLGDSFNTLQFISKALLLPILIVFLIAQEGFAKFSKTKWFIIIALFGSFLGDILLSNQASQLIKGVDSFILGMVAFMTTHIFNILFFNSLNRVSNEKSKKFYVFTILLASFCVMIFFQLKSAMGGLIYPVLIYMILICIAALMAIHAGGNVRSSLISKLFWFPGMLFFISSDTVLAFNKFSWSIHHPIHNIGLVTMLTYGIAQLLLAKGFQLYIKQQTVVEQN